MAGTEAELSDPASAQAPEKASLKPRRHWEWPGGESRRWVGAGLLFIQTREEEMNSSNKIMSQESKLSKVQPQQCDLGWAERFALLSGKTRQVSIFAHNTPGMRERECVCVSPKLTSNLPTAHSQISVPSHKAHTAKWPPCKFFWEEVRPAKHTRLSHLLGHRCPEFLLPLPKQELITSCSS